MAFISKEELEELYWGEPETEMGTYIIADKLGCSQSTIYRHLKKYNIPVRLPAIESNECMTKASVETISRKYRELYESGVLDMSGENSPNYGKKASAETRKKISEARIKYYNTNPLDKDIALEIYDLYKNTDISLEGLKDKYKHSMKTIHSIVSCKHWTTKDLTPISKSCGQKGISHPKAIIDKKTALKIYNDYKISNLKKKELANNYGVSYKIVHQIVNCKHWTTRDLTPIPNTPENKGIYHHRAKINKETGLEIYEKYKNSDFTQKDLAKEYGVNISTIGFIIRCTHWTTKDLTPISKPCGQKGISHPKAIIDKKTALKIYNDYKTSNLKKKELANNYGVSYNIVYQIANCKHWTTRDLTPIPNTTENKGVYNHSAKIDKEAGLEIYNKYKNNNIKKKVLANDYGVSVRTIGLIINCKHWTTEHLSDD